MNVLRMSFQRLTCSLSLSLSVGVCSCSRRHAPLVSCAALIFIWNPAVSTNWALASTISAPALVWPCSVSHICSTCSLFTMLFTRNTHRAMYVSEVGVGVTSVRQRVFQKTLSFGSQFSSIFTFLSGNFILNWAFVLRSLSTLS